MEMGVSLLRPHGYQRRKHCGYCKSGEGYCAYYLSCESMRVDHYQELMERGWRRAGTLYYKPDMIRHCCPHYTIRLKAAEYKAKRDQRYAVNKINRHVIGSEYKHNAAFVCPESRESKRQRRRDRFDVVKAVHAAEYSKLAKPTSKKLQKPLEPAHKFEVSLESDDCTKEKHKVLVKYQTQIHNDPESRWKEDDFKRFLCSGLDRKVLKVRGRTMKLGSYHMCYRLDGVLIAVAVLDLLPQAVSSVYLFYDPDYKDFDWGKISALHEIALAIEKGYEYYYMGYYIHSCIKMRYKGRFEPSYLLDPESLDWYPLDDELRVELDRRRYISVSADKERRTAGKLEPKRTTDLKAIPLPMEDLTKEKLTEKVNREDVEVDSDSSDVDDMDIPEGSLFNYNIPGVLTKEEVSKFDLDHMKLLVRDRLVDCEDLRGWEEWDIGDDNNIKGMVAELIATTGPKLLKNSALSIF